jgi:predicted ATPase
LINQLSLTSFKCFSHLELAFSKMNILTGLNGSGKSSVVQSLLLAYQASQVEGQYLPLAGEFGLDLGQASDILNNDSDSSEIAIQINGPRHRLVFDVVSHSLPYTPYLTVKEAPDQGYFANFRLGDEFTYLSAERLGPRISHPAAPSHPASFAIGSDGRYVAHALALNASREVDSFRRHPNESTITTLRAQVEAWLTALVGPTEIEAALVPDTNVATLRVRKPGALSEWNLPTNTGFGVSYCLPIIVAGLLAAKDGLLIVDSPEAHLHPAGQSAVGGFLARVAGSGVQVIVETHSDHVINGIRRAIAVEELIKHGDVMFNFFKDGNAEQISVSRRGKLSKWPRGFFDQGDIDMLALTRNMSSKP